MKNNLNKIIALLALAAVSVFGQQVTLSSTTLGAAVTSLTATTITVASTSTMLTAGPANRINTVIYVDKEYMQVTTVVDSTHVLVNRAQGIGASARPATHLSGAKVWFANTGINGGASTFFNINSSEVSGSCTLANLVVVPNVYLFTGNFYTCIGSQWTQVDQPGRPTLGAVVASSAGVMTPSGTIYHVSGTAAVTGIAVPAGFAPGMTLSLIPDAAFTTTTATNVSLASTAVANKTLVMTWDGVKWNPSY